MRSYLNRWFIIDHDGGLVRAKCVDIEFDSEGLGPIFLMEAKFGYRFWATRKDLNNG